MWIEKTLKSWVFLSVRFYLPKPYLPHPKNEGVSAFYCYKDTVLHDYVLYTLFCFHKNIFQRVFMSRCEGTEKYVLFGRKFWQELLIFNFIKVNTKMMRIHRNVWSKNPKTQKHNGRPEEVTSKDGLKWTLKENDMRIRVRIAHIWIGTSGGLL